MPARAPRSPDLTATIDPERRAVLLESGLRALVRAQWGEDVAERTTVHRLPGAVVLAGHDEHGTAAAWSMSGGPPALGPFLAWAHHYEVSHLHDCVTCESNLAEALARRATAFNLPATIWQSNGTKLTEVPPAPLGPSPGVPDSVLVFRSTLERAGADVVIEEGMLRGEVLGLEVARAFCDATTGEATMQVGVGRHDREARMMLGSDHASDGLAEVIATVRSLRRADAPTHPANQLAPERWLRTVVIAEPGLTGLADLVARPCPIPRSDLRQVAPAPALGTDSAGRSVVVVCSVGVDPELVPVAVDARFAAAMELGTDVGEVGLRLIVPERDNYPITRTLAGLLRHPADVVTVDADWRARSPD